MTTTQNPNGIDLSDRKAVIAELRRALKARSGKNWSVTGSTGTAWGWITITSPPARREGYGYMSDADRQELSDLLGESVHHQGASIPSQRDYRAEYIDRANGRTPSILGVAQWD